jgi:hypothetical protein
MSFGKCFLQCLAWLLISVMMCMLLAFGFALISGDFWQLLGLVCCALVHCLLMAHAGKTVAERCLFECRTGGDKPMRDISLLLGVCTALPLWAIYSVLWILPDSVPYLNAFLLMNAPFIQIHKLILHGAEPFSAVDTTHRIYMALPPVATMLSVIIGFQIKWRPGIAHIREMQTETYARPKRY